MRKVRTIATAAAGGALVLFGGLAAVRQQAPATIDADSLAAQLGLSAKAKAEIAPQIDQLNTLLARRNQMRQEHQRLWTQLQDVQQKIAGELTPQQRQGFMLALGRTYGYGPGVGVGYGMGYGMGHGPMGYGRMGPGHRGYGHMRRGGMGYGPMGYGRGGGWMRGGGPMMGGGTGTGGRGWMGGGSPDSSQGPGGR